MAHRIGVALLAVTIGVPAAASAQPRATWKVEMDYLARDGTVWWTSHAPFATPDNGELPAYGMAYYDAFGGTALHGCFWGEWGDRRDMPGISSRRGTRRRSA